MIRIAFNYSSICEILSLYPLSRTSPLFLSPSSPGGALTWCACTFDGNERWAKGEEIRRRYLTVCQIENMPLTSLLRVIRVSCMVNLLFISCIVKLFDLPKDLSSVKIKKLGHLWRVITISFFFNEIRMYICNVYMWRTFVYCSYYIHNIYIFITQCGLQICLWYLSVETHTDGKLTR